VLGEIELPRVTVRLCHGERSDVRCPRFFILQQFEKSPEML
jgi:hypothetical protein